MAIPGLVLERLTLWYGAQPLFEDLSLVVPGGQFVALLGPSGVGKTSLLKIAAGLLVPKSGSVRASDGGPLAGRIAYMGQQDLLFPWLDVIGNVMLGSRLRRQRPDRARAMDLLVASGWLGVRRRCRPNCPAACASARPWLGRSTRTGRSC